MFGYRIISEEYYDALQDGIGRCNAYWRAAERKNRQLVGRIRELEGLEDFVDDFVGQSEEEVENALCDPEIMGVDNRPSLCEVCS